MSRKTNWTLRFIPTDEKDCRAIVNALQWYRDILDNQHNPTDEQERRTVIDLLARTAAPETERPGELALPDDPDGMNTDRAERAEEAIDAFMSATRTDREDALCGLLADLMHWADRNGNDFEGQLDRARGHYAEETGVKNMTIRQRVSERVCDHAAQACINQHTRNVHTLYAMPDGRVYWGEEVSTNSWDVLSGTVYPIAVIYRTGTGSCRCNCDACTKGDDPTDWAGNDASELVNHLIKKVGEIEVGYFADEP